MIKQRFTVRDRLRSFGYAFEGLATLLKTQHNAWIHLLATLVVIGLGFSVGVTGEEWCFLILAMAIVWVAEGLNTALEFLADAVLPEVHPLVKKAKDVAATAVLIAATGAVAIGLIVFIPYF